MKKNPSLSILLIGAVLIFVLVIYTSCNTVSKTGCPKSKQGKTHDKNVRFNN